MSLDQLIIQEWPQVVSIGAEEEREELMQLKIPSTIQHLRIAKCEGLEKLSTTLHHVTSLSMLELWSCPKLISLSQNNLPSNRKTLVIVHCVNLRCLLEDAENVNISNACRLEQLIIDDCPSLTHFSSNSRNTERVSRCSVVSTRGDRNDATLLSHLSPYKELPKTRNPNLQGFQGLTSLEQLSINNCPNLKSLPEKNMLSSLLQLKISECPVLEERCEQDKGAEWSNIAHIPYVEIDGRYIYDSS
ncbi:hypothetical protein DITRI_Ditri09bG0057200 [Diplodiscus trichospermus]